jgi:hypothetical protein
MSDLNVIQRRLDDPKIQLQLYDHLLKSTVVQVVQVVHVYYRSATLADGKARLLQCDSCQQQWHTTQSYLRAQKQGHKVSFDRPTDLEHASQIPPDGYVYDLVVAMD